MSDRTKLGLQILLAALLLGVLADALLRVIPWGLNLMLWVMAGAGAVVMLVIRNRVGWVAERSWLAFSVDC